WCNERHGRDYTGCTLETNRDRPRLRIRQLRSARRTAYSADTHTHLGCRRLGDSGMLSSQRALFDIPRDVCFLNAASWSPLPLATQEAGRKAVARKGRPWLIDQEFAAQQYDRVRKAAAALINA